MIKTIAFDLGGVVITIDQDQAVRRFKEIGVADAAERLDPYTQGGIFGDLEAGKITEEEFQEELSKIVGKPLTYEQCQYAWTGYVKDIPLRNLKTLEELREKGFRIVLLSNTNPFMQKWLNGPDFPGDKPLYGYFDAKYLSYELKVMKPDPAIFLKVLAAEEVMPEEMLFVDDGPRNTMTASQLGIRTLSAVNGEDWSKALWKLIEN